MFCTHRGRMHAALHITQPRNMFRTRLSASLETVVAHFCCIQAQTAQISSTKALSETV